MNLQQSNFDLYKPTDMLGQPIVRNSIVVASTSGTSAHEPGLWIVRDITWGSGYGNEYLTLTLEKITFNYKEIDKIRKSQSSFSVYKNKQTNLYSNFYVLVVTGEAERILRDRIIKWLSDNKKDARDYV